MRYSGGIEPNEMQVAERTRIAAVLAHSDPLTLRLRDGTRNDIEALRAAGAEEPEIVRLAELAAFLKYQARVIRGLHMTLRS